MGFPLDSQFRGYLWTIAGFPLDSQLRRYLWTRNCVATFWFYIPGSIFLVLYSWLCIPGFIFQGSDYWLYIPGFLTLFQDWECFGGLGLALRHRLALLYIPGFIFLVIYSWFYIPGFVFLVLYSKFHITDFIFQALYSRIGNALAASALLRGLALDCFIFLVL
jgi:hypothetical protein